MLCIVGVLTSLGDPPLDRLGFVVHLRVLNIQSTEDMEKFEVFKVRSGVYAGRMEYGYYASILRKADGKGWVGELSQCPLSKFRTEFPTKKSAVERLSSLYYELVQD